MVKKTPDVKSVTLGDVKAADVATGVKAVLTGSSGGLVTPDAARTPQEKADAKWEKYEKKVDKQLDKQIKKNMKKLEDVSPAG